MTTKPDESVLGGSIYGIGEVGLRTPSRTLWGAHKKSAEEPSKTGSLPAEWPKNANQLLRDPRRSMPTPKRAWHSEQQAGARSDRGVMKLDPSSLTDTHSVNVVPDFGTHTRYLTRAAQRFTGVFGATPSSRLQDQSVRNRRPRSE